MEVVPRPRPVVAGPRITKLKESPCKVGHHVRDRICGVAADVRKCKAKG